MLIALGVKITFCVGNCFSRTSTYWYDYSFAIIYVGVSLLTKPEKEKATLFIEKAGMV